MNGFDLKDSLIPVLQINFGGPEKDRIPSIDKPDFVMAGFAAFLRNDDQVLGLVRGKTVRAYPLPILNWHEVVNDRIGKDPVVITFCCRPIPATCAPTGAIPTTATKRPRN